MSPTSTSSLGPRIYHPSGRFHLAVELLGRDLTFVPVPKCGSATALIGLKKSNIQTRHRVDADSITTSRALLHLREPTARLWSAYSMRVLLGVSNHKLVTGNEDAPYWPPTWHRKLWDLPFEEWLEDLVRDKDHQHLAEILIPQTEYLASDVDYEFVRWDFKELSRRLGCTFDVWYHKSKEHAGKMPTITASLQNNLDSIYGDDYLLWNAES